MHKNLIVTIMLGSDPSYHFVKKSFQAYADRVGADLVCITKTKNLHDYVKNGTKPLARALCEKLSLGEYLQKYERVLYLDADILITPHAKNIFEVYPDTSKIYMKDEGLITDRSKELGVIEARLGEPIQDRRYFNAGVILFSRESGFLEDVQKDTLIYFFQHAAFLEQTFINFNFRKHHKVVEGLIHEFNYMGIVGPFHGRLSVSFIHYAGNGFCRKKHRARLIMSDYCQLYGCKPSFMEKVAFLWGVIRSKCSL